MCENTTFNVIHLKDKICEDLHCKEKATHIVFSEHNLEVVGFYCEKHCNELIEEGKGI